MRIFIPSAGRSASENIQAGPVMDAPSDLRHMFTYVVPAAQAHDYMTTLENTGLFHQGVEVIPHNLTGIAPVRKFIGEFVHDCGNGNKFMMLDDDIRFIRREDYNGTTLRKLEQGEFAAMVSLVSELLEDYGHVGISARQGNNRMGVGGPRELVRENTRTMRALAYRATDFLKAQHCRIPVMEDFDTNLQLLRMGIPNANIGFYSQDQKMTNASGGCSEWRTHEVHEASAMKLAAMHEGFVSLRQKQNKTDKDGFGTRTEVTIQWKKAYASSNQTHSPAV